VIWQKRKKLMEYLKSTADLDNGNSSDEEELVATKAAIPGELHIQGVQEAEEELWNGLFGRLQSAVQLLLSPSTIKVLAATISNSTRPDQASAAVNNLARLRTTLKFQILF